MVKLIVGLKGSGKTKALIDMVNSTVESTDGTVICIEQGTKLVHEIKYQARLIDTNEYNVTTWRALYGFVAGLIAGDHDAADIFIDSLLKMFGNNMEEFASFINAVDPLTEKQGVRLTITSSVAPDDLPTDLQKYLV